MEYFVDKNSLTERQLQNSVAIEDCIMQKGKTASAGSRILEGFVSPFDSAAVERLNEAGFPIAGRTAMDEFGIYGIHPDEPDTCIGAVGAVASGGAAFALSNDIFGKARRQAPENNLCFIRPTYGTVSRYGLIPSASSMDQIGIVCRNPADGFRLLSVIAGKDERDGAMYPEKVYNYVPFEGKIRLAIPDNAWADAPDADKAALAHMEKRLNTVRINLKHFELYKQVLFILAGAEICNNTNRYDGVKYGYRTKNCKTLNDLYVNTRSEALGREAKLMSVLGAMVLSKEHYTPLYEKSMKLRRAIQDDLCFDGYDLIAMPSRGCNTPYEQSALYAQSPLAGLPSLTIPIAGGGIQLIAGTRNENVLVGAWEVAKT